MIPSSSSCVKLVYVLVLSQTTRHLFWTLHSERCVRIAIYCWSGVQSGATRKSGGVERTGERALQKNDGAERCAERGVAERERSGNGARSGGYRIRLEHRVAFSPAHVLW